MSPGPGLWASGTEVRTLRANDFPAQWNTGLHLASGDGDENRGIDHTIPYGIVIAITKFAASSAAVA